MCNVPQYYNIHIVDLSQIDHWTQWMLSRTIFFPPTFDGYLDRPLASSQCVITRDQDISSPAVERIVVSFLIAAELDRVVRNSCLFRETNLPQPSNYCPCPPPKLEYPLESLHLSYAGLTADHTNNPTVAPMNKNTTAWSFALSLWKHVVNTFSSFAVEHMGRLYDRQNCLVQSAQVRA